VSDVVVNHEKEIIDNMRYKLWEYRMGKYLSTICSYCYYSWSGSCERLSNLSKPTLVITGTQDITSPPANSIRLAEKIPAAWFVQIEGGGHGVMFQYPEKFAEVVEIFLEVTA
jgi:pimeloyl-ACP methyl ester carboxylesterase